MNIHLENVNLQSTSGPNHFANKLIKYLKKKVFFSTIIRLRMFDSVS